MKTIFTILIAIKESHDTVRNTYVHVSALNYGEAAQKWKAWAPTQPGFCFGSILAAFVRKSPDGDISACSSHVDEVYDFNDYLNWSENSIKPCWDCGDLIDSVWSKIH